MSRPKSDRKCETLEEMMRFYALMKDISLQDAPVKSALWGTFRGLRRFRLPKKFFRLRGSLNKHRQKCFSTLAPVPLGTVRRQAILSLQDFVGVLRHCEISLDDRHAYMSKHKALMLLNMIPRKMGELHKNMLNDDTLMDELNGVHMAPSEPDNDKFLDEVKHAVCWFVQKQTLVPLEDHVMKL
ncbi:hypothetical protein PsorP6_002232 [Peronosclerospora sorghi]|uniref:Uncharacterized protein n=1 Tax=Peronosclerospora sorghi TaxID=230839 RepID=A0ACC0WPI9_9STRA|nr:hypothetical protein PsorP6_002232 [Peronosclerospora sorghi]